MNQLGESIRRAVARPRFGFVASAAVLSLLCLVYSGFTFDQYRAQRSEGWADARSRAEDEATELASEIDRLLGHFADRVERLISELEDGSLDDQLLVSCQADP